MAGWDTSCVDWVDRLLAGRSLVPDLPLFRDEADRALRIFKRLRLPDVIGTPTMAEACGEWFFPIVAAIFGSYDPSTDRRMIQEFFELIPKGNGKALALDTPIATPTGFKSIAAIQVGDEVMGADGRPTKVTAKSPVFIGHSCFEVEFSTNEKVICDAGHLWVTDSHRDRDRRRPSRPKRRPGTIPYPTVKTTEQIASTLKVTSGQYQINNHRTALCQSLDLPEVDVAIPPYALGVWLGDGTTSEATVTAWAAEADLVVERLVANGQPAFIRALKNDGKGATIQLSVPNTGHLKLPYRFRTEARRIGLLGNKHIPPIYLRGSKEQRLKLLQGLMDTDGTISKTGQASFTTTLPRLRDDVCELINSLGFKSSVSEKRAKIYGRDCGPVWNIQFWPFDILPIFALPRKLERQRPRNCKNMPMSSTRQITNVRPVHSVPVQCISVDNESKQFLITRSLIPTHNSSAGGAVMVVALIVNRRPEGEFLLVSPTKEIADIAFKQASGTIRLDPELTKLFHIQRHIRLITHRKTGAALQIKAADTDVITGSKALGTMIDEVHVFAKKANAADVFVELRGALAKRTDGFLFQTTTQSKAQPTGVFRSELAMARKVRDGLIKLPLLPVLYELPPYLAENNGWKDRKYWPLVNPNLGRSVDETFLVNELMKAEDQGPAQLALIASQHFNVEIGLSLRSDRWAGADYWLEQADETLNFETIIERSDVVVVGIDGGGLDDLLGFNIIGREKNTGNWLSWARAWVHKDVLDLRKSEAQKLLDLEVTGDLTIVGDLSIARTEIANYCARLEESGLLAEKDAIGVDQMGIGLVVQEIAARDIEADRIVGIPQGWMLNGAIKTAEVKLSEGTLIHAAQELMNWAVGNAKVEPKGNAITITKQTAGTAKIDPLMAMLNCVSMMSKNPASRVSAYEDEEMVI